jgi:tetratricopeptide (TPR) repeat protein
LEESLRAFRGLNDHFYMARVAELIGDCYGFHSSTIELFQAFYAVALEDARRAGSVMDEAHILGGLGWGAIDLGQFADAEGYYREAMALLKLLISVDTILYVKLGMAFVHFSQGRMETARRLAEESLAVAREFNTTSNESVALLILSLLTSLAGDAVTARQLAEQSLQTSSVRYFRSYTEWSLAIAHCGRGNYEQAWRHLHPSLQALRTPSCYPRLLAVAAVILGETGHAERAAEILGSVFTDRHSAHGWMEQWQLLTTLRARLRIELGEAAYQRAYDRGSARNGAALADELFGLAQ